MASTQSKAHPKTLKNVETTFLTRENGEGGMASRFSDTVEGVNRWEMRVRSGFEAALLAVTTRRTGEIAEASGPPQSKGLEVLRENWPRELVEVSGNTVPYRSFVPDGESKGCVRQFSQAKKGAQLWREKASESSKADRKPD
jgi:hypothetical protein